MHPVSSDYELEASGPAFTRGSVNPELGKRKMEPPSENNQEIGVEIHQQTQPQTEVVQASEPTDNGRAFSTPLQGLLKASREWPTIIEQDDWPLRETNMGAPSTGKGTESPQEENSPQNLPNKERGDVVGSDYIIETINASLLAAVKALTWQSHKMEIHLELTHMLAQSILTLDSKLNSLCRKQDNWDHNWREDKLFVGPRNDEILDKLATLPDLLTSIIQHCKTAAGNYNKITGKEAVENQQETGPSELPSKEGLTALTEGEDGSRETEPNNMQQTAKPIELQPSVVTNAPANIIEEQAFGVNHKSPFEHELRTKHQPQLTR
ncbi:hypothetical protein NDU88_001612 [Pleurodeles waltl]|uniref:Uncharacterized protein n=1 Tax=Pleurodeles waltl TaxID=8319 RepID=A0AAV7TIV2_PLEWA|nr:hypothetical protein NDU88_001612 [Pleurodeles waltl]